MVLRDSHGLHLPVSVVQLLASITKLTDLSCQHLLVVGLQHQPRHAAGRGVLAVLVVILGCILVMWISTMPEKNSLLKKYGSFI